MSLHLSITDASATQNPSLQIPSLRKDFTHRPILHPAPRVKLPQHNLVMRALSRKLVQSRIQEASTLDEQFSKYRDRRRPVIPALAVAASTDAAILMWFSPCSVCALRLSVCHPYFLLAFAAWSPGYHCVAPRVCGQAETATAESSIH